MKYLFLALLTFVTTIASAQTITVKYFENYIINNLSELEKMPKHIQKTYAPNRHSYTLTYSKNKSVYGNHEDLMPNKDTVYIEDDYMFKNTRRSEYRETKDTVDNHRKTVYTDYAAKRIQFKLLDLQTEDNFMKWDWQILPDTLTVAGYKCQKATTTFYNTPVSAWFTKALSVSAGPYLFHALPGLILKIETMSSEFVAYEVMTSTATTPIEKLDFTGKIYTFDGLAAEMERLNKLTLEKPLPANAKVFRPE